MEIQGKRGDVHPITGKIFWKRDNKAKDGVWWVTPEKYAAMRSLQKSQNEAWYESNAETHKSKAAGWYQANKSRVAEYQSRPLVKKARNIRKRLLKNIANKKFPPSFSKLIGCDFQTFKSHITSKFKKGMSWKNHGDWHFDHIRPFSSAASPEEIDRLAHYTNIQPLWAKENRKKHNSV